MKIAFTIQINRQIDKVEPISILRLLNLFSIQAFYVRGEIGIDDCPEGYFPINEPSTCVQASKTLGLDFSVDINTDIASGKCYWCEGCTPKGVRIDSAMGGEARLICQPRGKHIPIAVFPWMHIYITDIILAL